MSADRYASSPDDESACEAERALLGSILLGAPLPDDVSSSDFYALRHRLVWDAMCELREEGKEIDLVSVPYVLERAGTLDQAGGRSFPAALVDAIPDAQSWPTYAWIVRDAAKRRRLRRLSD